jgi:hypothetical protein
LLNLTDLKCKLAVGGALLRGDCDIFCQPVIVSKAISAAFISAHRRRFREQDGITENISLAMALAGAEDVAIHHRYS